MEPLRSVDERHLNEIRLSHARWAGGLGFGTVFLPLVDLAVLATIWTSLLVKISRETGHPVDDKYAKKCAGAMVKGSLLYMAGSRLGTWLVSLTGVGAPGAMVANAGLNYGYTYLLGGFLIDQFKKPEVDFGGLAQAAVAYLLSFGVGEVGQIQDLHDAAVSTADAQGSVLAAADIQHASAAATPSPAMADLAGEAGTAGGAYDMFGTNYSVANSAAADAVRFSGLEHTQALAGYQGNNPWCGVHGLGNIVQMCYPGMDESINGHILRVAGAHGGLLPAPGGLALNIAHYQPLLQEVYHIPTHWEVFDTTRVGELLRANHGILAVGDAYYLDPTRYAPNAWHAINITDVRVDNAGTTWFKGLDSNVPGAETWWPADAVQAALSRGREAFGVNTLVTDAAVAWPWKSI